MAGQILGLHWEFPDPGSNPGPLHWEWGVLATGPREKSQYHILTGEEASSVTFPHTVFWRMHVHLGGGSRALGPQHIWPIAVTQGMLAVAEALLNNLHLPESPFWQFPIHSVQDTDWLMPPRWIPRTTSLCSSLSALFAPSRETVRVTWLVPKTSFANCVYYLNYHI